jgi:hypothetical protein
MNYNYQLIVREETTDQEIARISAHSEEGLVSDLHKIDKAIEAFEEKHTDYGSDNGQPSNEE